MSAARADGEEYVRYDGSVDIESDDTRSGVGLDTELQQSDTPRPPLKSVAAPDTAYVRFVKPILDRVGAAVLLVVTAPLLAATAIAVRLTMGSPVLLPQKRVGRHGKVFTILKFRTMEPDRRRAVVDIEDISFIGVDRRKNHKDPNDPRITAVGAFLRKWSLDELPQFLNVLRGEMSLVGPRPEMVAVVAKYEQWQHDRHRVKPGVTGPWQISERGDKPLHECTESDLRYLDEVSLAHDLKILALTPLAALGIRRGA